MAFKPFMVRLPEEYCRAVETTADDYGESQGYICQIALYAMMNGKLPLPRRRDTDKDPNSKTREIKVG